MQKTKHQRYETCVVMRSAIHEHPLNPRVISDKAKKNLKGDIQEFGLLSPILVSRATMYVLGGHQRLAQLDKLEKYSEGKNDYALEINLTEMMDEASELKIIAKLNNKNSQGEWDIELLADLNLEHGLSFEAMGFDNLDVSLMFDGDSRFGDIFPDTPEVSEAKDALKEIKEHRKESTERMKDEQGIEFYFIVVCKDKDEKHAILRKLKLPLHEKYVSGNHLNAVL